MGMGMTIPTTFILPYNLSDEDIIAAKLAKIEYKNESVEYVKSILFSKNKK
jgi:hypothetical protein